MSLIEKFMGIAFTLIALGLILANAGDFNMVVNGASQGTDNIIGQLQKG